MPIPTSVIRISHTVESLFRQLNTIKQQLDLAVPNVATDRTFLWRRIIKINLPS